MSTRSIAVSVLGFAVITAAACTPPIPASTVDQSYTDVSATSQAVNCGDMFGQSFTAGRSGKLDKVSFKLRENKRASAAILIYEFDEATSQPGLYVLGTGSSVVPIRGLSEFTDIKVPTPAEVTAGHQYFILFGTNGCAPGDPAFDAGWVLPGGYGGGTALVETPSGWEATPYDFEFRTWVR